MKAKELKEILTTVDDDADVVISDADCKEIQITGMMELNGRLLLDIRHEMPVAWFADNGIEVRYIKGAPIKLDYEEVEDSLYLDKSGTLDDKPTLLKMHDGYAESEDGAYKVTYPKLAELTDEQIEDMDDELGGRISDSGFVGFDDVCVWCGMVEKPEPKEPDGETFWVVARGGIPEHLCITKEAADIYAERLTREHPNNPALVYQMGISY